MGAFFICKMEVYMLKYVAKYQTLCCAAEKERKLKLFDHTFAFLRYYNYFCTVFGLVA